MNTNKTLKTTNPIRTGDRTRCSHARRTAAGGVKAIRNDMADNFKLSVSDGKTESPPR